MQIFIRSGGKLSYQRFIQVEDSEVSIIYNVSHFEQNLPYTGARVVHLQAVEFKVRDTPQYTMLVH
jgi:hypothetical protein